MAETLHQIAALLCDGEGHPVHDPARIEAVRSSTQRLDQLMIAALEADVVSLTDAEAAPLSVPELELATNESIAGALDPGFHARALGIATEMVADATLEAAGAEPASGRRLGMADETAPQALAHRLVSHLSFRSVWFRNALRGAVGLALAVGVVEITNVSHGFWVVLGTMSVLRSSALGTGATALRAVGGTAVGFIAGSVIMIGLADHSVFLWVVLPIVVLLSGMAPSMISFAAGQAAFTLVVIILFNIIQPIGWKVGLTRIEDVAIGCGVSIVVGIPLLAPGSHRCARASPLDGVCGQLGVPGRRGRAVDGDQPARGHGGQPASVTPRLPHLRRRLPSVLRRAGSEGGVGGDHLPALHRLEPAPSGRLHPRHLSRAGTGSGPTRARVRGRRRGRPA